MIGQTEKRLEIERTNLSDLEREVGHLSLGARENVADYLPEHDNTRPLANDADDRIVGGYDESYDSRP